MLIMRNLMILVAIACSAIVASGATVAYWQLDEAVGESVYVDAVGIYDINITNADYSVAEAASQPVVNPDAGPFDVGSPSENPSSIMGPQGGITATPFVFGMRNQGWTLEGYIKPMPSAGSQFIAATRSAEIGFSGWEFALQGTGRLDVRVTDWEGSSRSGNTWSTGTGAPANPNGINYDMAHGVWHHFALVWDPDQNEGDGSVMVYVNHTLQAEFAAFGDLGSFSGEGLVIGGRDDVSDGITAPTGGLFISGLDELRWSNQALSPEGFLGLPSVPEPDVELIGHIGLDELKGAAGFADMIGSYNALVADNYTDFNRTEPAIAVAEEGMPNENPGSIYRPRAYIPTTDFGMNNQPWTMETYVKPGDSGTTQFIMASRSIYTDWWGWDLGITNTGRLDARVTQSDGSNIWINTGSAGTGKILPGQWYLIGLTWEPETGTLTTYINRLMEASRSGLEVFPPLENQVVTIGARQKNAGVYDVNDCGMLGSIDEIMLFSGAKIATQLSDTPSPVRQTTIADMNFDASVDIADFAILAELWLQ
jgi:hypothetical protein